MNDAKSRVNTYLYTAQVLADRVNGDEGLGTKKALVVGASLSLLQAWSAWLEELASYLKLSVTEIENENSATVTNQPDCQLIYTLKRETGSWLQQLFVLCENPLHSYEREFAPAQNEQGAPDVMKINLIDLTDAQRDDEGVSSDMSLIDIVREFKAYIQHTREQQTEW